MRLRLLADDLTGALDTAAAFSGDGAVPVFLSCPDTIPEGGAALDLACREGSEAAAIEATVAASPFLVGADIAYLKIDSLLRGHWAAMLTALWRGGTFRNCVLAPAFPDLGRVTRGGRQMIRDATGAWQPASIDPRAALATRGVNGIIVRDAASDVDLRTIVAEGRTLFGPVLWCGTAGLAAALANSSTPAAPRLLMPTLAVIGSHHAATLAQLRFLSETTGLSPRRLRGTAEDAALVSADLRRGACLLQAEIATGAAQDAAAARIADILRAVLPRLAPPATVIATGGETLRAICETLAVERLEVEGIFAPGVPCSRLVGGAWDGRRVVSKSGAFGAPDLLARLFARLTDFDKN